MYNDRLTQMGKIRYGVSYWADRQPRRRPTYPRHRGQLDVDVAIVGGGIAGCATAYALSMAGLRVGLFETGRIGDGAIGSSTALVMQEPDVDFQETLDAHGLGAARAIWKMTRRGAQEFVSTLRRLKISCQLETQDSIYFAEEPEAAKRLRGEWQVRQKAGLEARWLKGDALWREARVRAEGAIRVAGNAQVDPVRACVGLAAAAVKRGARVHERSPVERIRPGRRSVELRTAGGSVTAGQVVVATGQPGALFRPLARHFRMVETYAVATPTLGARIRAELGRRKAMLWDAVQPYRYLRWTRDDRVLFGGGDQAPTHPRSREKALVQRTGQLMYELSVLYPSISGIQPEYAWAGQVAAAADGLPYIGPHRNYPRHAFALGFGGSGLAQGFLASRILARHCLGEPAKGDELFGFTR
ncbi:MAG: FAD-dependent oxidoreductase [Vicinamibacterales bacterium]|jgi:glycine/D-amino acid oxidase-like deaminating enzyme|nr:hypothetical protein [Acidobacteriota bacterium]MDP7294127.1 FAD-dependent oxidoreductase [Vicinamibacterales bacterium]MDP7471700.1 FAD-dependent oxidoreductase [Vicinamibacterales bacterium]MDP7671612.1 FAD-dependent oxidoreductase [Vicinamibacterales bacterium]HJO37056.1 FAD-dependent oxidoreductase [Vicinamibacterales bacterium]|tara:strand:+ start:2713 stop:3957 length:1245 start_codon:yes stop_codon:yes gene_type:complete